MKILDKNVIKELAFLDLNEKITEAIYNKYKICENKKCCMGSFNLQIVRMMIRDQGLYSKNLTKISKVETLPKTFFG